MKGVVAAAVAVLQRLVLVVEHWRYVLVLRDSNDLDRVPLEMGELVLVPVVVREEHSSLYSPYYLRKWVERGKQLVRKIFSLVAVHWKELSSRNNDVSMRRMTADE